MKGERRKGSKKGSMSGNEIGRGKGRLTIGIGHLPRI
jgi:hypothetical protein